jgi:hypothetical protein
VRSDLALDLHGEAGVEEATVCRASRDRHRDGGVQAECGGCLSRKCLSGVSSLVS